MERVPDLKYEILSVKWGSDFPPPPRPDIQGPRVKFLISVHKAACLCPRVRVRAAQETARETPGLEGELTIAFFGVFYKNTSIISFQTKR